MVLRYKLNSYLFTFFFLVCIITLFFVRNIIKFGMLVEEITGSLSIILN